MSQLFGASALAFVVALAPGRSISASAEGDVPVVNGDFETGDFTGWIAATKTSSEAGWSVYSGRQAPWSGARVPRPPDGAFAALADQSGPGSNVLYQDIQVTGADEVLRLTVWYRNWYGRFFSPPTLSYRASHRNQQLRIDLIDPEAKLRSVAPDDILTTVMRTRRGDAASLPLTVVEVPVGDFVGQTVRLRVAEVDNQYYFQVGVDDVMITSDAPTGSGVLPRAPARHRAMRAGGHLPTRYGR